MTSNKDLSNHRRDYESHSIGKADMHPDPVVQFAKWLQEAIDFGAIDATAMTLAPQDPRCAVVSANIELREKNFDVAEKLYRSAVDAGGDVLDRRRVRPRGLVLSECVLVEVADPLVARALQNVRHVVPGGIQQHA